MRNELFNQTFDESQYFKRSKKTYFARESSTARHALLMNNNQTFDNSLDVKRSQQLLGNFKATNPGKTLEKAVFKGKLKSSNKGKM